MLTPVQNQILSILSGSLYAKASPGTSRVSEEMSGHMLAEAAAQTVLPLVAGGMNTVPGAKAQFNAAVAKNLSVIYAHTELHELLSSNGIPYVILKGCASASFYADPVRRTMGDVDFLVRPEDVSCTGKLLESIGFVPEADRGGIHIAYHRDDASWEMHRSVNGIPSGTAGDRVRGYLSNLMEAAEDCETTCGTIRIPAPFHHCLILLLHTAAHLTSEGIGLRHLCDWAVFARQAPIVQWKTELQSCGLWEFARILTLTAVKYLGLPEQPWAGTADEQLLEGLISDIFEGGNFGHKDAERSGQIKYIANRGQQTVDAKPPLIQVWHTIGAKAKAERKSRLSVMVEYVGLVLSGQRKADSSRMIANAQRRKKLYRQLQLFQTE